MAPDFLLNVRFKGTRTYVQVPDVHDAVCDVLEARGMKSLEKIDLTCHRMIKTQLGARFIQPGELPPEGSHATFRFISSGIAQTISLVETGTPIKERIPYEEETLVALEPPLQIGLFGVAT